MNTFHIHIRGRVQGVGFRPAVYRLATQLGLTGVVSNTTDGVHIYLNGSHGEIRRFMQYLRASIPKMALVEKLDFSKTTHRPFEDFSIRESEGIGKPDLLITPDFGLCESCLRELRDPTNVRFAYPFITCTQCGPRYSVISELPYDRPSTSMAEFNMCDSCQLEFRNPSDRRFYSQTNSCKSCAVELSLHDREGNQISKDQHGCLSDSIEALKSGQIIAVKGIGGYLLMADATNEDAVNLLRKRKRRPKKPFALIYPDLEMLKADMWVTEKELREWVSPACPIVLYRYKTGAEKRLAIQALAPGLDRMGIMPPYTPLFVMITDQLQRPIVATSGNISGSPIIYEDKTAFESLGDIADLLLSHNRRIVVPQDDSVVKFSRDQDQKVIIRRSRGYAPSLLPGVAPEGYERPVLAMGASIKSTFALWDGRRGYLSQFLGETSQLLSQESFEHTLEHLMGLLKFVPEMILVDSHPDYYSTQYGKVLADRYHSTTKRLQHHKAHFAAALAENHLMGATVPILGIIWDGTGLGTDGAIWGGECFIYHDNVIDRYWHLPYYPHIGGDRMALDPRLAALAVFHKIDVGDTLAKHFDKNSYDIYLRMLAADGLKTSSMGRLFDAVAAISGLCTSNTYEGEAAMIMEKLAADHRGSLQEEIEETDPDLYFNEMIRRQWQYSIEKMALKKQAAYLHFHLAGLVKGIIQNAGIDHICFSGGVFQNTILIDMIIEKLSGSCNLYFHKNISPNDEGVAYGQMALHCWGIDNPL